MRILIVEDETKIASFMRKGLKDLGYAVEIASDGDEGLDLAFSREYDILVVDIALPGTDGVTLIRKLRERQNLTPAIIVSARGDPADKVRGLDAGADDYMSKPFDFDEFLARIRALLRKKHGQEPSLSCADLSLDTRSRMAVRSGKRIELSNKEYALLEYLLYNRDQVLGRAQILSHVWNLDFDPGTNVVEVYIRYLRDKLDRNFEPKLIHTRRGTGYVLSADRERFGE